MSRFRLTKTKEELETRRKNEEVAITGLQEFFELLSAQPKKETVVETHEELIVEQFDDPIDKVVKNESNSKNEEIVEKAATEITKSFAAVKENIFNQPIAQTVSPEISAIQKKIQGLEQWLSKVTMTGPGSGEVNFRWLDDVNRATIGDTDQILRYNPVDKKFFFGQLSGDQGPIRSLQFDLSGPDVTPVPGMINWNSTEDCLDIHQSDGTVLQVGLENYIEVYNNDGATAPIENGTVVAFKNVFNDEEITAQPLIANGTLNPLYTIGVVTVSIPVNELGRATILGKVRNLNTTGSDVGETWQRGDILWAHPTLAGKMTRVRPTAPDVAISIAAVLKVDATNGILMVRPTIFPRLYYGAFYSTQAQTAAAINTAYPITFNNLDFASGFTIDPLHPSRIVTQVQGLYNYQFSLQVTSTNSSTSAIWIWYRKNGVDVPHSATKMTIASNGGLIAPAWNFVESMDPNDYFELMWAVDSTAVSLVSPAATAFCPSTPSALISVTQVTL